MMVLGKRSIGGLGAKDKEKEIGRTSNSKDR